MKNPFPRKGVVNLEGTTLPVLRTLPTKEFMHLSELAIDYKDDRVGQVAVVVGPYGSGKTHLIQFAKKQVEDEWTNTANRTPDRPLQIYVKLEQPGATTLAQRIVTSVGEEQLRLLNTRVVARIALEQLDDQEGSIAELRRLAKSVSAKDRPQIERALDEAVSKTEARIREEPYLIYAYLDQLIFDPSLIHNQHGEMVPTSYGEDFKKAFYYLGDPLLGGLAYRWFAAGELTERERSGLGVKENLRGGRALGFSLSVLLSLFHRAQIPLWIYVDQVEKLFIDASDEQCAEGRTVIKTLCETCIAEALFISLVGADEGWSKMLFDFWGRVGAERISLPPLSVEQGLDALKLYSQKGDEYEPFEDESEIAPFTIVAVREMVGLSGGNFRRFVQLAYHAFEEVPADQVIGTDTVRKVASTIESIVDRESALRMLKQALRGRFPQLELDVELAPGIEVDLVVGAPSRPTAIIAVSDALFHYDEARRALQILGALEDVRKQFPSTLVVVVVAGYASPELSEQLGRVVDSLIVLSVDDWKSQIESLATSLARRSAAAADATGAEDLRETLIDDVRGEVQQILDQRGAEVQSLVERFDRLVENQMSQRRAEREASGDNEWRAWLREDQQRWEVRRAELTQNAEENQRQVLREGRRRHAERLWLTIGFAAAGSVVAGLFIFLMKSWLFELTYGVSLESAISSQSSGHLPQWVRLWPFYSVMSFLFAGALVYSAFVRRRLFPLGRGTSRIHLQRDSVGKLMLTARDPSIAVPPVGLLLNEPDPAIRFAGFYKMLQEETSPTASSENWALINRHALAESWQPLYRLYVEALASSDGSRFVKEHLRPLLDADLEDIRLIHALTLMAQSSRSEDQSKRHKDLPPILGEIWGQKGPSAPLARVVAHAIFERVAARIDIYPNRHPLIEFAALLAGTLEPSKAGYLAGLADMFMSGKRATGRFISRGGGRTEQEVRAMIDLLSPYSEGGLSSYISLPISSLYLRIYRFLSEELVRYENRS